METLMKRTDLDEAADAKAEESSGEIPMPEVADIVWDKEVKHRQLAACLIKDQSRYK